MAPEGAPPKDLVAQSAWRRRPIVAHPSHVSWLHRELNLMSQWRSPHGGTAPSWHASHTFRGTIRSSTS
eukprot:2256610-Pyramimonas_sp.AAC.1